MRGCILTTPIVSMIISARLNTAGLIARSGIIYRAALFHYALLRLAPLYTRVTRETVEALGDIDYEQQDTIEELNNAIDSVTDPYWLELALIKHVYSCQWWTYSEIARPAALLWATGNERFR